MVGDVPTVVDSFREQSHLNISLQIILEVIMAPYATALTFALYDTVLTYICKYI